MARTRVFNAAIETPNLESVTRKKLRVGRRVYLKRLESDDSSVVVLLSSGELLGSIDPSIGVQIASALERGQEFKATILNTVHSARSNAGASTITLRVEYLLERGQTAIHLPKPPPPEEMTGWKFFYTKVVGVSYLNADGSSRQAIIRRCQLGDAIRLLREPDNPEDPFAVQVVHPIHGQVGYLSSFVVGDGGSIGPQNARSMDEGYRYYARIANLIGGGEFPLGINLQIGYWRGRLASQPAGAPEFPPLEASVTSAVKPASGGGSGCLVCVVGVSMGAVVGFVSLWL
jgi:hypothetical protein